VTSERTKAAATSPMVLPLANPDSKPSTLLAPWHRPFFIVFLLFWVVNEALVALRIELTGGWGWVEGGLIVSAVFSTLLALGRRLPAQNVLMTAVVVSGLATGVMAVATLTGVPLGPFIYTAHLGEKLFNVVPWPLPLLWLLVIINGRGVARLVMRPWRKTNFYGFWVIGLACLFAVIFDLGLEPFAVYAKGLWVWQASKATLSWHTAPWVNFLGWFIIPLAILSFSIPWLINKQPVKQAMDYHPLIVWLLLNGYLATGNALDGRWSAVAVTAVGNAAIAIYAIRGARW
jgi:bisanhydrobacterioruberin hydratase